MLYSSLYGHCLGVVLQLNLSTKSEKTISILVLCEQDIDDEFATAKLFPGDSVGSVQPYEQCKKLFSPRELSHTVVEVPASSVGTITATFLKVEGKKILDEFKTRLIPRFRYLRCM